MAEAGNVAAGLDLAGEVTEWPLKRYGRFMLAGAEEPLGPHTEEEAEAEAGSEPSLTWKVFDSNEESGCLILSIVISGHFFISQGQTLLEGFSLIGSKNWLKIVRRMDCLLFGATIKNKSRMFRVQFGGASKEEALEHCRSCVKNLAQYVSVQEPGQSPGPPRAGGSQGKDCAKSMEPHLNLDQQGNVAASTGALQGRTSVAQLAQAFLASGQLPLVYAPSPWGTEELGPFLRLCLMDQNFPAFVEDVEKELKKLKGLRN